MPRKEQISSITHPDVPRRSNRIIVNPANAIDLKQPFDPLTDLQEKVRFRNAFAEATRINTEMEDAIKNGVLERITENVMQEHPFVENVWSLSERYDNDPNSRG